MTGKDTDPSDAAFWCGTGMPEQEDDRLGQPGERSVLRRWAVAVIIKVRTFGW